MNSINQAPPVSHRRWISTLIVAVALAGGSCSQFDSDPNPVPECACLAPLVVTGLVQGSEVDSLLSLSVELVDFRFLEAGESSAGIDGSNLLRAPAKFELLGLDGRAEALATGYYPEGTLNRVRVELSDQAPEARGLTGAQVNVGAPLERVFVLRLPEPITGVLGESVAESIVVELDCAASLKADGVGGDLSFDPVLRVRAVDAAEMPRVDLLHGVAWRDSGDSSRIRIQSNGAGPQVQPEVSVIAQFSDQTRYFEDGDPMGLDREEFMSRIGFSGRDVVAAGRWSPRIGDVYGSSMLVTSVRIVGDSSDPPELMPAFLEGRVVGSGAGNVRVRVVEVNGNEGFENALMAQADPETVVAVPETGALVLDEDGDTVSVADLSTGARVVVKIDAPFAAAAAYSASSIVRTEGSTHRGTFMDDAGETRFFLLEDEAAIEAGAVGSSATPIALELGSAEVVLDVVGRPALSAVDVLPPLGAAVAGVITGTSSEPTIENPSVIVRPGRLDGVVSGVAANGTGFDASVVAIHAPFGGAASAPPFQFTFHSNCVFEGDASSAASFIQLFEGLAPGESLGVNVAGLGTTVANEIVAYEVRARVE